MLIQLQSIGIHDTPFYRDYVEGAFTRAFYDKDIAYPSTENAVRTLRELVLAGPNGVVKVESVWENNNLIAFYAVRRKIEKCELHLIYKVTE